MTVNETIFFYPDHKRWPRLLLGMIVVGFRLSLLLLALILSSIASTLLLSLNQPSLNFLPKHARTLSPVSPLFPERTLTHRERLLVCPGLRGCSISADAIFLLTR